MLHSNSATLSVLRKGDVLDVRLAEACIHAVVVSARAHRISVCDTTGKRYSFPKRSSARMVRPFAGSDEERSVLQQLI